MKWISTLDNNDLESMKQVIKLCKEESKDKGIFQNSEYEISYLQNVVHYLETSEVTSYLADLVEDDLLMEDLGGLPSFEDTMNLVKEQQKEEK